MNRERMQLMHDMLREVEAGTWRPAPPEGTNVAATVPRFNLSIWSGVLPGNCGFSACAVGHACLDPRFNAQGLALSGREHWLSGVPVFKGSQSWWAVEDFFDIQPTLAHELFDPLFYDDVEDGAITPGQVADRIATLLREEQ